MESDEEEESVIFWKSHPFLRLYQEDENHLRLAIQADTQNGEDIEEPSTSAWPDPRFYVVHRFFRTIKGFHMGSLDLSGRHLARYEKIMERFHRFTSDLLNISSHATPYETMEDDRRGRSQVQTEYKFADEKVWMDFVTKWALPRDSQYSWLLTMTQQTLSTISQSPSPKLQKLCLIDLPIELLEIIMDHASIEQARLLSATCKILRRIGLRFIYSTRSLRLEPNPDWEMLRAQPDTDHYEHLCDAALASRNMFLDASGFLLSRTDMMEAIGTLNVRDGCSKQALRGTLAESFDIHSLPRFYAPIHRDLVQVLRATNNLTTLRLSCIEIFFEFLTTMSRLKNLHTLSFVSCNLDTFTCDGILVFEDGMGLLEAVVNLELALQEEDTPLYTLLLCPGIRTLLVAGPIDCTPGSPAHTTLHRVNPFKTLERFSLNGTDPDFISFVSTRMSDVSPNTVNLYPNLTHFKIQTAFGLADFELFGLMNALRLAPNLQVLVLEGLADVHLEAIDYIAEACPNLLGLTLIRRHNERQHETKLAMWPHTSAEYASRFSAFSKLRYFAWNFRIQTKLDPTPALMTQFENGFPNSSTTQGRKQQHEIDNVAYFDDAHLMAALFAAHCPTLKTFAIVERSPILVCEMDRTVHGSINVQKLDVSDMLAATRVWDTNMRRGWPMVAPIATGTARQQHSAIDPVH